MSLRRRFGVILMATLATSVPVLAVTGGGNEAWSLTASEGVGAPGPGDPAAVLADAAWIERSQTSDGALGEVPAPGPVSPYGANIAARGLARAAAAGDSVAARAGWAWCEWYARHQGPEGYVTDYVLQDGVLVSTGTMDSTDAYSGTFLSAVRDLYAATLDVAEVRQLHIAIARAVGAIESTQDVDGLTWAKPTWLVKYLMDNAEVYDGLVAASQLALVVDDAALAQRSVTDALRVWNGVQALWNNSTGSFDWALNSSGRRAITDWSSLYPDAMEEVWAVAYGLATPTEAQDITQALAAHHPNWDEPTSQALVAGRLAPVSYWPVGAWAEENVGNDALRAIASIRAAAESSGEAWPYNTGAAGELIIAEAPPLPQLLTPTVSNWRT